MNSRRSFLAKAGTVGVGTVVGVSIAPSPQGSRATVEGAVDRRGPELDTLWDEPIVDDDSTPIVRYHYKPVDGGFEPTAPINVVVPLPEGSGLGTVIAVLVEAGWTTVLEEYVRYAWDREAEAYVRQHATAAETYYGTSGRLHVRCWEFEGVVSMQAHEDTGAYPKHAIASYERARTAIESLYATAGWGVASAAIDLDNAQAPDHDGRATVLVPGGVA